MTWSLLREAEILDGGLGEGRKLLVFTLFPKCGPDLRKSENAASGVGPLLGILWGSPGSLSSASDAPV